MRILLRVAVSLGCVLLVGCGGMDQDDIRARAIRRPSDPEEPKKKPKKKPNPAANKPAPAVQPVVAVAKAEAADPKPDPEGDAASEADDRRLPPIPPDLPQKARVGRSIQNMMRIAEGLRGYLAKNGKLPDQGRDVVSWRVELLPYLGYGDLYAEYDQYEPWNSPKNQKLLAKIPPVYQSPERRDSRTNYQLVTGKRTAYWDPNMTMKVSGHTQNQIILVEVDEDRALNWTQPRDFVYELPTKRRDPIDGLGGLRNGNILGITGNGRFFMMPAQLRVLDIRTYFQFEDDGGARDPVHYAKDPRPYVFAAAAAMEQAGPVASTAAGGGPTVSVAPVGGGAGGPAVRSGDDVRLTQLGVDCWNATSVAARAGDFVAAWRWSRGAVAVGLPMSEWSEDYRWISALRRPSLGVHIAVALPGQATGIYPSGRAARDEFVRRAGPAGATLLSEVEKIARQTSIKPIQTEPGADLGQNGAGQNAAPVSYILDAPTVGAASNLAREAGADLLVFFDPNVVGASRSLEYQVQVYDLFRGRRLLKTDELLVHSPTASAADLRENLQKLVWDLSDFFEDELVPQPWPVKLTPSLAAKRVDALSGDVARKMRFATLVEFQYYRQKGMIDDATLLTAVQGVLGRSEGIDLVLGDPRKQRRVMRAWLPHDDPAEYVSMAAAREARARRAEEDD